MSSYTVEQAYQYCQGVVRHHYENFPVASILLPRPLRQPVSAIYAFARMADDFADEGTHNAEQRSQLLEQAKADLLLAAKGNPVDKPVYIALADLLSKTPDLLEPMLNLLIAFNMDVEKKRYADFGEVMEYCRYSANPVGRMLLILYNKASTKNIAYADAICSALQLINFLQDIAEDYKDRDRIYMPADELQRFQLTEQDLITGNPGMAFAPFMDFQIQRAYSLLQAGAPLGIRLKGRTGLELRMVILGGWKVLQKLHQNRGNIFAPNRLQKRDWLWVISRAFSSKFAVYLKKLSN
jgi:squalene synthase HpnC